MSIWAEVGKKIYHSQNDLANIKVIGQSQPSAVKMSYLQWKIFSQKFPEKLFTSTYCCQAIFWVNYQENAVTINV